MYKNLNQIFTVIALTAVTSTAAFSQAIITEFKEAPKPAPKQPVMKMLKGDYYKFGDGDSAFYCHESVTNLPTGSQPGIECISGKGMIPGNLPGTRLLTNKIYSPEGDKIWTTDDGKHKLTFY